MRALLLSLGVCLLPAAGLAQQNLFPPPPRSTPTAVAIPLRQAIGVCGTGAVVRTGCGYNRRLADQRYRAYRSYERGVGVDRDRWDNFGRPRGSEYDRRAGYFGPLASCPAAVGGVAVVSPPNPRYRPRPGRPYRGSYTIVPVSTLRGCNE